MSNSGNKILDKRTVKPGCFPVKVYEPRNSLLTDLFAENEHVKSIHNLGIAIFLGTVAATAAGDYARDGHVYLGFRTIYHAFRNFPFALFTWIFLFLSSIAVYLGFMTWAKLRRNFAGKIWDRLWLMLYMLYYPSLLYFAYKAALIYNLGIASSLAVLMEATRFLMKAHAFVRSNCPKYLQENKEDLYPTFGHYMYFSFAPVLVYKDTYPRYNGPIRWRILAMYFLEFISVIIFYSIIFERMFIFRLNDYGLKTYTWKDILAVTLENFGAGLMLGLLFFYAGLHIYTNMTAEIMRFSDRLFYKDWWTTGSPEKFYRTWNILVHDWLYVYIYKDLYENVFRNKKFAKLMVFLASAVIHDYIICVSGRLFLPAASLMFTTALIPIIMRIYCNEQVNRAMFWFGFGLVHSGSFVVLNMEIYARANCPLVESSLYDYIKPRLLYC